MFIQKYGFFQLLEKYWYFGLVAFVVSLILTPVARSFAYKFRIVDKPDDLLKPHCRPVAYLGGIGIAIGLLAGLADYGVYFWRSTPDKVEYFKNSLMHLDIAALQTSRLWMLIMIAVACIIITLVGLVDDIRNITPRAKIFGQMLAAGFLLLGGVGLKLFLTLFGLCGCCFPAWLVVVGSCIICMVLVICTCNATNLLDGLDGLCGGVTAIIALGFLCLATWLATWGRFPATDELRIAITLAMAGAILGFLPYNIPPASIFMGDAGSMLLGFFVAVMISLFSSEGLARWAMAACVVYALPILDTSLAVVRRVIAGRKIFEGDRGHLYDQLVDRGMSVKKVVLLFYVLSVLAAVIGNVVAIKIRFRYALVIYSLLFLTVWVVFVYKGMVNPDEKRKDAKKDIA